jgi:hypothetical protein
MSDTWRRRQGLQKSGESSSALRKRQLRAINEALNALLQCSKMACELLRGLTLQKLPLELRDIIYSYVLIAGDILVARNVYGQPHLSIHHTEHTVDLSKFAFLGGGLYRLERLVEAVGFPSQASSVMLKNRLY